MAYLLDADVFIRAKNLHYGFDFCPAYWDWLVERNAEGKVFSVEKVGDELRAGADELAQWAAMQGDRFFLRPDAAVVPSLAAVSAWAMGQHYDASAVSTFLQIADYYLVSQAHAGRYTVVTHELPAASLRKIKIPDACIGLGIKCMTPFEMLRVERARFILASGPTTASKNFAPRPSRPR
ncbi:MAG: DUF4411 family protein [Candidatus Eisenbacteria bacterium]|nr:DUF4411 family protein [Candidatus Eisenbacteria bacterium]